MRVDWPVIPTRPDKKAIDIRMGGPIGCIGRSLRTASGHVNPAWFGTLRVSHRQRVICVRVQLLSFLRRPGRTR